jgi:UTP--glucose-1-phosphate uridylyltransferase
METNIFKESKVSNGNRVKKVVIPIAGLGTRFLPLSKILPKELWPLVDKPVIQYIVEEAKNSGICDIIFVISPEKRVVLDYFKKYYLQKSPKLEKTLKERKKHEPLKELINLEELCRDLNFSFVLQKKPLGDGHAILQARNLVGDEPFGVLFGDDIVDSKIPCILQLAKIFKTCQKPVVALQRVPRERLPYYGVVGVEKIANRLFKIKKFVEKPTIEAAPSDLAIVGKYILTPEVFDYLKRTKPLKSGEIILANAFAKMIEDGKMIYGYEFEGEWLECGTKDGWVQCSFQISLKHPKFSPQLKGVLKKIKI